MRTKFGIMILLASIAVPCFASRTLKDEIQRVWNANFKVYGVRKV